MFEDGVDKVDVVDKEIFSELSCVAVGRGVGVWLSWPVMGRMVSRRGDFDGREFPMIGNLWLRFFQRLEVLVLALGLCGAALGEEAVVEDAPVDPQLWALGGVAGSNSAVRRCEAAMFFRQHPDAAGAEVVSGLAEMLGDERRVSLSGSGFGSGLPGSPGVEARKALEVVGARAVEPLMGQLRSPSAAARERAAVALGRIGDGRALPALVWLLKDGAGPVSLAASDALVRFGTNAAVLVREYLSVASPTNAARGLWVLGQLKDDEAVPLLMRFVADDDERTRLAAGAALANLGESSSQILLKQWHDADEEERLRILGALHKMRSAEAMNHVVMTALSDRSARLRAAALRGIPAWTNALGPLVLMCAQRDSDPNVRDQVRESCKDLGAEAARAIVAYLDHPSPVVWQAAATALMEMKPEAAEVLFASLRDPQRPRELKRRAAWVLMHMGELKASYDDSLRLRIVTEDWLLINIFTERIPGPLAAAARNEYAGYRIGALSSMALLKLPGADEYLFKALDDEDPDVVQTAQRGLAGYGYTFVTKLEQTVQHGSVRASRAAAGALAQIDYRPRTQAMGVEFHASRGAVDQLTEMGGLVPTHLERRLERSLDPVESSRLAMDLAHLLPVIPPDDRFAADNVVVRAALVGTNRAARLRAMQELTERPNLLLALSLDNDAEVAAPARRALAKLPGTGSELIGACLRSGETLLVDLGFGLLELVAEPQLAKFDWLLAEDSAELRSRTAKLFASRQHKPADEADQITMAVENSAWADLVAKGGHAVPAMRNFIATSKPATLSPLLEAMAASDDPAVLKVLVDSYFARDEAAAEFAWPAIQRAALRLRGLLSKLLAEGDLVDAYEAAALMDRLGFAPNPGDAEYIYFLVALVRDKELDARRENASRLLSQEIASADPARRLRGAIWAMLLQLQPRGDAPFSVASLVESYIEKLQTGDAPAKTQAAVMLSQLGTNAMPALPELLKTLGDNTPIGYRGRSSDAYFSIRTPADAAALAIAQINGPAVDALLAMWKDENLPAEVRGNVARAISQVRDARCADAQLLIMKTDSRLTVKTAAMHGYALSRPKEATAHMLKIASGSEDQVLVASALNEIRALGADAVPPLLLALNGEDSTAVEMALSILTEFGEKTALAPAIRLAHGPYAMVRCQAAKMLGRLADLRGTETLIELLDDRSMMVQWSAVDALRATGRAAVPKLVAALPKAKGETMQRIIVLLKNITGENFGSDATLWSDWLKNQK